MNRQRWLRTRRRRKERAPRRARPTQRQFEELKAVAPEPYADYLPDMPWERR